MLRKALSFLLKDKSYQKLIKMAESLSLTSLGKRPAEKEDETTSKSVSQKKKKKKNQAIQLGKSEGCKRKMAMLVAYNGAGYYGVQINPGFPTIESEFFPALVKIGAIPQDHADTPSKMWFQRGSRTDKGVSAVGQIFTLKITVIVPDLVTKLNEEMPPQIRVLGYIRSTNSFDSKNWCDSRTYMYMMPTFAFAPLEKFITDEYRVTPEILDRVRQVLNMFVGTHKFHNFTSGVKFEQAKAARYIIKFECSEPYVREDIEFVTLRVKGQSFMLHHIRKMIGLTIAILRGYCGESVIESCWGPEKVDVPKAPGLGLVLEALHFDGYNKKFGSDGVHEPIEWSKYQETADKFKEEHIISHIVSQEKTERVMFNWLRTLQFHNFNQPRLDSDPPRSWVKTAAMLREMDQEKKAELSDKTAASSNETDSSQILPDNHSAGTDSVSSLQNRTENEVKEQLNEANIDSASPRKAEDTDLVDSNPNAVCEMRQQTDSSSALKTDASSDKTASTKDEISTQAVSSQS